jgi:enoyl-CoA hydratase/carnithine racemase
MGLLGDIHLDLGQAPTTNSIAPFDLRSSPDFHGPDCYFPTIPKPVIAAINGPAIGIGFVYTLYCDLRLASDSAYVMTAFVRRGAVAEYGASWLLPRLVGMTNATELMFSSRKVLAEEALRMGLLNRVVPGVDFLQEVSAYASMLATECSPRSLAVIKRQLWNAYSCSLAEDVAISQAEMTLQYQSEDFKEGVAHFVEKRAPKFTGR